MAQHERAEQPHPRERSVQRALQFAPSREPDADLITSSTRKKRREPAAPLHSPPAKRSNPRQPPTDAEAQRVEDLPSPELKRRKSDGDAAPAKASQPASLAGVPAPPIPQGGSHVPAGRPASEPPRSKVLQLLSPVYNLLRPGGKGEGQEAAPAGGRRSSKRRQSRSRSPEQLQMAPVEDAADCAAPAGEPGRGGDRRPAASEGGSSTDGESETCLGTRPLGALTARLLEYESDGASERAAEAAAAAEAPVAVPPPRPDDDEEEDCLEFDPYAFIKSLPPLAQCAPAWRRCLLPKQTRQCPRKTLVLDLDETLVHSSLEATAAPDFRFEVAFNGRRHAVAVRRRPHLAAFLERCAELFEVVIFTASQKLYAEQLLNILDPERRLIRHRVYRDACLVYEGNYLKDLTVLGRDLAHTLIVDNSPQAFGFQLANGVPIESWYDDAGDRELLRLLPFLESLVDVPDVRPVIADAFKLHRLVARAPSY